MDPRLNIITLGVRKLDKAVAFYRDGLGWPQSSASVGDFLQFSNYPPALRWLYIPATFSLPMQR